MQARCEGPKPEAAGGVFVRMSTVTLLTRAILILVSMGASIVTARVLGPTGKGELSIIILAPVLFINLGGIAITSANVFLIGNKKAALNEVFWNSAFISICLGVLLIAAFGAARPLILPFFQNAEPSLLLIAVMTIPFSLFYSYGLFIPLGERKIAVYNLLKVIEPVAYFLALLVFVWWFELRVAGGLAAYIVGILAGCAGFLFYAGRNLPLKFKLSYELGKEGSVYAVKCHLESAAWFLIRRSSVLLINRFLRSADVGYYVVALSVSEVLWHLPQSISTVLFPEICAKDTESGREAMSSRVCRNTLFILAVSAVSIAFIVYYLIKILYGREFLPSVNAVLILLPGAILLGTYPLLGAYMRGVNKPLIPGFVASAMLASTVILNILLIPRMGIYGAALATTVTYGIGFVILVLVYSAITAEKARDFLLIKKEDFRYYRNLFSRLLKSGKRQ